MSEINVTAEAAIEALCDRVWDGELSPDDRRLLYSLLSHVKAAAAGPERERAMLMGLCVELLAPPAVES